MAQPRQVFVYPASLSLLRNTDTFPIRVCESAKPAPEKCPCYPLGRAKIERTFWPPRQRRRLCFSISRPEDGYTNTNAIWKPNCDNNGFK